MTARLPPLAPGALPIVGHAPLYARDPLRFLMLTAASGRAVRMEVGPLVATLLREPEDIERILVTEHKHFIKDEMTRSLSRVLGSGLLTSDGESWLRHRRLLAPAFHRDRMAGYAAAMVEAADRFVRNVPIGQTVDLAAQMMGLTLEIVARTLFDSEVTGDAQEVFHALEVINERFSHPLFFFFPRLGKLPLPLNQAFENALRRLDTILLGIVRAKRESPKRGSDLLSTLIASQDDAGKGLSETELRDELMTLFLAGHETTALALTHTLSLLAQSRDAVRKLQEELDSVLGSRSPTLDDLPNLPFVRAVVLESMRLYPPAWAIGREALGEVVVGDYVLPKGSQIWAAQWVNHRDPRYFPAPERFLPERWLGGLARSLPKFAYYPFGGGPRVCIGQAFATMEAELVLATLMRRLVCKRLDDAPPALAPIVTLRLRNSLSVRFSER